MRTPWAAASPRAPRTQLGLQSDLEVQIPKSIHRLRLAGGGTRFVHGGATLQEIVVPVLAINKKRKRPGESRGRGAAKSHP